MKLNELRDNPGAAKKAKRIGRGPGVAKDQRAKPTAVPPEELKGDVSAHRQSDSHDRFPPDRLVEHREQVVHQGLHRVLAGAHVAGPAASDVRSEDPPVGRELLYLRGPHLSAQRKPVEEEQGRSTVRTRFPHPEKDSR